MKKPSTADRHRLDAQVRVSSTRLSGLIAGMAVELQRVLDEKLRPPARPSPPELDAVLHHTLAGYTIAADISNEVLNVVEAGVESGIGEPAAQRDALRHYWLTKEGSTGGLSLADRINDRVLTAVIYRIIRNAVEAAYKLSDATVQLYNAGCTRGDMQTATANVLRRARQSAASARRPETAVAFAKTLRQRLRAIDRLADPGITKLRQAYGEIADLCNQWVWLSVRQAVNYAANDLQSSNAERLLNTEGARAYGMARRTYAMKKPGVAGLRVRK